MQPIVVGESEGPEKLGRPCGGRRPILSIGEITQTVRSSPIDQLVEIGWFVRFLKVFVSEVILVMADDLFTLGPEAAWVGAVVFGE